MKILAVLWAFFCAGIMCLAAYSVGHTQQRPTGQVSVTTSAVSIGTATSRLAITIKNDDDSTAKVHCGVTGVTASTGFELGAGQAYTAETFADLVIQCIAASGTQTVHFWEARR